MKNAMSLMKSQLNRGTSLIACSLLVGVMACSGGSGSGNPNPVDGGDGSDGDVGADGGGAICAAADDFGNLGAAVSNAFSAPQYLTVDVQLASATDLFVVELFEGAAPFEGGFAIGTYEINGTQTDYNTCGACVSVWANIVDGNAELVYLAQSGTLVIESIDGDFVGNFTPRDATASFVGYRTTSDTSSVEVPECTLNGGAVTWDAVIETR